MDIASFEFYSEKEQIDVPWLAIFAVWESNQAAKKTTQNRLLVQKLPLAGQMAWFFRAQSFAYDAIHEFDAKNGCWSLQVSCSGLAH